MIFTTMADWCWFMVAFAMSGLQLNHATAATLYLTQSLANFNSRCCCYCCCYCCCHCCHCCCYSIAVAVISIRVAAVSVFAAAAVVVVVVVVVVVAAVAAAIVYFCYQNDDYKNTKRM